MQTERATALAAAGQPAPEGAGNGVQPITAESFRLLAARLTSARNKSPPRALDNVIPLRKTLPRPSESQPAEEIPQRQPDAGPRLDILPPPPRRESGEEAGDTAITLLELMAATTGLLPQERALASDTLLMLLPRMPARQLARLAERVAIMDNPPPLLAERLIRDPRPEIMGPVLERSANICDRDMIAATALTDLERLRMIAKRRTLSAVLSGHLAASGDPGVILALLRNTGAEVPHQCFAALCALAAEHPVLRAPLATRAELPPEVAFELYWNLPPELRRLMLSRFLTDSGTLGRILRIALTEDSAQSGKPPRGEAPLDVPAFDAAIEVAADPSRLEEAAARFADLAGLAQGTALRILSDRQGEPAAVLFKAIGVGRSRFVEILDRLRAGGALEPAGSGDLQAVFDGLSFTKAGMLLTYWDWFTRKAGPYAPCPVPQVDTPAPC